jgi:hypothetical protein
MGFDLSGFTRLERAMERASDVMALMRGSQTAKRTLKKALNVIVQDARGRVNNGPRNRNPGTLRDGIQGLVKIDPLKETVGEVGVSYKRSKKAHHAHLVEYGHANFNQHGGPYTPPTPAHPFWAPAVEAKGGEALKALEEAVSKELGREWKAPQ